MKSDYPALFRIKQPFRFHAPHAMTGAGTNTVQPWQGCWERGRAHFLGIGRETGNLRGIGVKGAVLLGNSLILAAWTWNEGCALDVFKTRPVRAEIFVENGWPQHTSSSVRSDIVWHSQKMSLLTELESSFLTIFLQIFRTYGACAGGK
jgi:hypothetical protein